MIKKCALQGVSGVGNVSERDGKCWRGVSEGGEEDGSGLDGRELMVEAV